MRLTQFLTFLLPVIILTGAAELKPIIEIEEEVYSYSNANNGASPMWCAGSTSLVRVGETLFASGLETIEGASPLNNCRWVLFERTSLGWERVHVDTGRTREPSPLIAFHDGSILLSANPTLGTGPEPNGGPARPEVFLFAASDPKAAPARLRPRWQGTPRFSEHSYRSFAADGAAGELVLFQNIGYAHAEWSFRNASGEWAAQGQLQWPWGAEYDKPQPVRLCYPNVAIQNRAVHFFGVSDIIEPYHAWREYKKEITGREWDYDFRRLFYTWTPDVTQQPFRPWIEIASRDKTCGWVWPSDLYLAPDGRAHLLWTERAIDERLREKFFPDEKQSHSMRYALLQEGRILRQQTLVESTEEAPGVIPSAGRFHVTGDGRLFVVFYASGTGSDGRRVSENRVAEILPDGTLKEPVRLEFEQPFTNYFTTTPRGGSPPSPFLEMLGQRAGAPLTISYARVRLFQTEQAPGLTAP